MEFKQCHFEIEDEMRQLVALQNEVYKSRGLHFTPSIFKTWYIDNPNGKVISFNAFDNGKMVAHQSFVPEEMLVNGRVVKCVRSMAVVTHPDYQRQGLFATVTNKALEEAKHQGFEFAYAITNENSTPVFLKHCGFIQVTQLQVKIGLSTNIKESSDYVFKRFWTDEALKWRLNMHNYRRFRNSVIGKYGHGVSTYMATIDDNKLNNVGLDSKKSGFGIYLYIGLGADLPISYMNMPKFVKRSPFNLIYQDLTSGKLPTMTSDNVFYQLLDYDVI